MRCPKCNARPPRTARFCCQCGSRLRNEPESGAEKGWAERLRESTHRQQIERAVQDSELRYRTLFENSPDAIFVADGTGRIRSANEAAARMHGYTVAELLTMSIQDLYDPDTARSIPSRMQQILTSGPVRFEVLHRRKDGTYFPLEVVALTMRLGEETFFLSFDRDLTDRRAAQEQLRRREELFQLVWDNAADGMRLTDAQGIVVAVNAAYCRLIGKARQEIEGRSLADVYAVSERAVILEDYRRNFAKRQFLSLSERPVQLWDGRDVWLELSSCILPEAIGGSLLITIFRDATPRKLAESALNESRERFREIAETVSEVFWSADPATSRTDYVSPSYERVWGRSCTSLYDDPKSFLDAIHAEDRQRVERQMAKKSDGQPFEHEYRILRPDGAWRWIWDRGFPIRNPADGAIVRYVGVATDVTERKLAESALRIHSEILLNLSDGVAFVDEQGVIRLTNRAQDAMFGYESGELVGRHWTVFNDGSAEENERLHSQVMESLAITGTWSGEQRCRRKDGAVFWTSTRISRLEQPGVTSYIAVQEDITARKERDEIQAALREQLAHAARLGLLGEMATGLAHELNQPLTALHLYASIGLQLGENLEHAQLSQCLQKISSESLRAGEIIRRIRAFASRAPARHALLDLNALIHEVLAILALELRQAEASIHLQLQEDLPAIRADSIQIQQVLVNLVRNALDAMSQTALERRRLTISTSMLGSEVRVDVQDTGCGFTPASQAELFQPFHTTKPAGLGLGLAISRSLIEAHGGRIAAEPHPAGGALFTFSLPLQTTN